MRKILLWLKIRFRFLSFFLIGTSVSSFGNVERAFLGQTLRVLWGALVMRQSWDVLAAGL